MAARIPVNSVCGKINYGGLKHNSSYLGLVLPSGGSQSLIAINFLPQQSTSFLASLKRGFDGISAYPSEASANTRLGRKQRTLAYYGKTGFYNIKLTKSNVLHICGRSQTFYTHHKKNEVGMIFARLLKNFLR